MWTVGIPPSCSKAWRCLSRNASCEAVAYARWIALPEYDSRSAKTNTLVFTPAHTIH